MIVHDRFVKWFEPTTTGCPSFRATRKLAMFRSKLTRNACCSLVRTPGTVDTGLSTQCRPLAHVDCFRPGDRTLSIQRLPPRMAGMRQRAGTAATSRAVRSQWAQFAAASYVLCKN
jgi:hypothetical protein